MERSYLNREGGDLIDNFPAFFRVCHFILSLGGTVEEETNKLFHFLHLLLINWLKNQCLLQFPAQNHQKLDFELTLKSHLGSLPIL